MGKQSELLGLIFCKKFRKFQTCTTELCQVTEVSIVWYKKMHCLEDGVQFSNIAVLDVT